MFKITQEEKQFVLKQRILAAKQAYPLKYVGIIDSWLEGATAIGSNQEIFKYIAVNTPKKHQKPTYAWRVAVLSKKIVDKILSGGSYRYKNTSSWSHDKAVVIDFAGDDMYQDHMREVENAVSVMFYKKVTPIVDLHSLFKDKQFWLSVDDYTKKHGPSAVLETPDEQEEIIAKPMTLTVKDIHAIDKAGYWEPLKPEKPEKFKIGDSIIGTNDGKTFYAGKITAIEKLRSGLHYRVELAESKKGSVYEFAEGIDDVSLHIDKGTFYALKPGAVPEYDEIPLKKVHLYKK